MANPSRSSSSSPEPLPGDAEARRSPTPQIVRTGPVVRPVVSLRAASRADLTQGSGTRRSPSLRPSGSQAPHPSSVRAMPRRERASVTHPPKLAAVLSEWRRAEQLTEALPAAAPDHETAGMLAGELRALYANLTNGTKPQTREAIASSQLTIRRARRVLDAIAAKARQRRTGAGSDTLPRS